MASTPPQGPDEEETVVGGASKDDDLFGDGGVIKTTLEPGEEHKLPKKFGDEVRVVVQVAALDGSAIEEHGELEYMIGSEALGSLGRVVDKALLGMRLGEKASFRCGEAYAGGAARPGGATVTLKLLDIYEVRDVSFCSDGSVIKKTVKEGEGYHTPREGVRVTLAVSVATDGGAPIPGFEAGTLVFAVGSGDVCDAVECAAVDMKFGEKALVTAKGSWCIEAKLGLQDLRAEWVMFTMEMQDFEKQDAWMSEEDKIAFATERKEIGNALLKSGRFRLALQRYDKVTSMFAYVDNFEEANEAKAVALRQACESNKAAVHLKLGEWTEAKVACDTVLRKDKHNIKAFYRRAQALLHLKNFSDCIEDCKTIVRLDPENKEAKTLLKQAQAGQKQDDKKVQGLFANMCKAFGDSHISEAGKASADGGADGSVATTEIKAES